MMGGKGKRERGRGMIERNRERGGSEMAVVTHFFFGTMVNIC